MVGFWVFILSISNSIRKALSYNIIWTAFNWPRYSASVDDLAMHVCLWLCYIIGAWLNRIIKPDVDIKLSRSSVYNASDQADMLGSIRIELKYIFLFLVPVMYRIIRFRAM
jgi:hypothetical protein